MWRKDGEDIPLSVLENSRLVGWFLQAVFGFVLFIYRCAPGQFSEEPYEYLMKIWRRMKEEKKTYLLSSFHQYFRYAVDDGALQIMNVDLSDEGIYTCVARTSLDEENATALLTVLGEARFSE